MSLKFVCRNPVEAFAVALPVVVSVVAWSRRDKLDRLASANKIKWPEEADDPPLSRRIVANEYYIKQQLGWPAYIPKKARGRRGVQDWPAKCWSRRDEGSA